MTQYDAAFRRLAEARPADLAWLVLGQEVARAEAIEGALPAQPRNVDSASRVVTAAGERIVLHVECELRRHPRIGVRVLEYQVRLHVREELPVLSAVLRLEGGGPAHGIEEYSVSVAGRTRLRLKYEVITLSSIDSRELLESKHPSLLVFTPLCRGGQGEDVLEEALERIESSEEPENVRGDLLALTAVFGGVHGTRKLIYSIIRRMKMGAFQELMERSCIYQDIKAKGLAEGRAQGMAEGMAEGKAEGKAEGLAEGKAEGLARAILRVLEARFGRVPDSIRAEVSAPRTVEALERWLDDAVAVSSLEEFGARVLA